MGLDVDKIEQLAQDEKITDDCIEILEKNDEDNKEKQEKSQDENIQDNKKENQENSSEEIPNQEIENQENEDLLAPPDGIYPTKSLLTTSIQEFSWHHGFAIVKSRTVKGKSVTFKCDR